MAVEHPEEADLRPFNLEVRFVLGLQNVKDDAYPILIIVSNNPLISIGRI